MSEILTGAALEAEMLVKLRPVHLVRLKNTKRWTVVLKILAGGRLDVWALDLKEEHRNLSGFLPITIDDIDALHPPTDTPQMPTAFLMGQGDTVTKEGCGDFDQPEAIFRYGCNLYIDQMNLDGSFTPGWMEDDDWMRISAAWDGKPFKNSEFFGKIIAIKSPGGNVRRIVKGEG